MKWKIKGKIYAKLVGEGDVEVNAILELTGKMRRYFIWFGFSCAVRGP
jgi:hypothetical protein